MPPVSADDFLDSELDAGSESNGEAHIFGALQAEKTSKKDYRAAYIYINVTSYSQRGILHDCPRKYQIYKSASFAGGAVLTNIDFLFGHSVGAGIQTYLATGNKQASLFAAFLAWGGDLDTEVPKKGKSSSFAILAVEKFIYWWDETMAGEWELATFNGRAATELTFFLDTENGFYHAGHIDAVLRNKKSGRYIVLEIKTTAIKNVDDAQYGNSEQPLGYSLVLDKIVEDLNATNSFEILYLVYSSTRRQLIPLSFTKSRSERVDWLQDLLLDHTLINTYKQLEFFPKRGDSCWSFNSRCPHYGLCDLQPYRGAKGFQFFDRKTMPLPEPVDFEFTLGDITRAALRGRAVNALPSV